MKKSLLILMMLLVLVLIVSVSCGDGDTVTSTVGNTTAKAPSDTTAGKPTGTTASTTSSIPSGITAVTTAPKDTTPKDTTPKDTTPKDTTPPVTAAGEVMIAGTPLKHYTIVYAKSEYEAKRATLQGTEYDFYKLTAEKIAADLKAICGVTLPIVPESRAETEHEILVGPTNRAESSVILGLNIYTYKNAVLNGKLVVGGGREVRPYTGNLRSYYVYAATYHAFDFFADEIKSGKTEFKEGYDLTGETHFTTIACVGDSITEGVGASDPNVLSYPAILQRILLQDYVVLNFGNSGKTMRNDLGSNYTGTIQHTALINEAYHADLTLVMLGTNDSYFDRYWIKSDDDRYNEAAISLFDHLRRENENMKLVVMNCPAYYGNQGSGSPHVRNLQAKLPTLLKNEGIEGVMFYNMHEFTDQKLGISCFPDLLHPNDRGYGIMAKGLAEVIPSFLSGKWDYVPELVDEPSAEAPDVPIAEGAENILGKELDEMYPFESSDYPTWYFGGAPYVLTDHTAVEGYRITNIELPVALAMKGNSFTVQVVKYQHPNIVEVRSVHKLTATFDCTASWAKFAVNIEVPKGYTLAFGQNGDTLSALYLQNHTEGYTFYSANGSFNNMTLAFNLYGIKLDSDGGDTPVQPEEDEKEITAGSKNLIGKELDRLYPIEVYHDWIYTTAPYTYMNEALFAGKVITDIELPIGFASAGSTMKLSVVKLNNGLIVETKETITLTADKAYSNEWVMFSGLSLEVPEGYTVAFGSSSDTIHLRFIHAKVSGYEFYSANGAVNGGTCLAFNVYGKDKTAPASKPVTEGSVNLLPMDAQRAYPLTSNAYHQWDYNGAPYILIAQNYFGGKTVTDIEAPILASPAGGKMTVSVVKMNGSTVKETLKTYTLTVPSAVTREWVCFSDLEIVVPEGYTLAFGAAGDTATLAFIAMDLDGYAFYNRVGSPSGGASILFNVYGK